MHSYCFPWSDFLSLFLFWVFYRLTVGVVSDTHTHSLSLSLSHTHTHTHTHSVRLLWTRDRSVAETAIWQHTIFTIKTSMPPAGFEPAIPASERPQTHRTATGIGLKRFSRRKLYVLPSFCRPIKAISSSYTALPHSYSLRLYYARLAFCFCFDITAALCKRW